MLRKIQWFLSFFSIISLFLSHELNAQETQSTTQLSTVHSLPEAKKFEWEIVLASEQIKNDETHNVFGQYTSFKNSLLYSLTPNDQFRLFNSFVSEQYEDYKDQTYLEFAELMYRRKSILTEDEHGVNLDIELKQGYVIDSKVRKHWGFDSETIPQIIFKKHLNYGYGVDFKARHHFFHRNNRKVGTIVHEDRLYFSVQKMIGHEFLINSELKYRHKIYPGKHYSWEKGGMIGKNYEETVLHPGVLYFASRQMMIEGYLETKLNTSFDSRPMSQVVKDELLIGAAFYFSII